jgi:hypothetical protein
MKEKELILIELIIYAVADTLDAIRPAVNSTVDLRLMEAKQKAEKKLENCIVLLNEIKKK